MTIAADCLLMVYCISITGNHPVFFYMKAIAILNGQVLQGNIIAIYIHGGNTPVIGMITSPFISCDILRDEGFVPVFTFQNNIMFCYKDLFIVNSGKNVNSTRSCRAVWKTVDGLLYRSKISFAVYINNEL